MTQVINDTLDVEGPAQATPFNVLTVDAGSFGTVANSQASFFVLARDIGAAPPSGRTKFSVRGDGLLSLDGNASISGAVGIREPARATPFNVLTVDTGSFGTVANSQASFFILARDIGAAPPSGRTKFSVRGDGLLTLDGNAQIAGEVGAARIRFSDGS